MLHPLTAHTLAFGFGSIGWLEISVLAVLGVLLFGKRLPEVGRSIGKGIVEFKKGLSGIEDDIDTATKQPPKIEQHKTASVDEAASDTAEKTESSNQGS
jgi:sec-independent protein translocase protein TatA